MREIDIQRVADHAPFTRFHGLVLFWCAAIIIFDGYDLAVAGIALPSIMQEMGVDATQAGFMVSSALFGMMFGNVLFGALADRLGRRLVIVACIGIFSLFTAAAGLAPGPLSFSAMRFLAGVGIGGVMPNVVAHMSEYSPRRMRNMLVTLMFSGYSLGGILAAVLGKALLEQYGWQSVFLAAGLPVLLLPLVWKQLPESMGYLARKGRQHELRAVAKAMDPWLHAGPDDVFVLPRQPAQARPGNPLASVFAGGRLPGTLMLWTTCFMSLFMVYALSSWLAKLMAGAGHSLGSALNFVLMLNFGAMVGAVGGGWLADRFNIRYVLGAMYALAAVSITLLGAPLPTGALFAVVALAGATTIGAQIVTSSFAGQYYPMEARSTGIGLMLGVGRVGAISAPIIIGVLVGMALPLQQNFIAIAIPGVIGAIAIVLVRQGGGTPPP